MSKKTISPTKEMLEILESWAAPDVTATKQKEMHGKTNFLGMPLEDMFNKKKSDHVELEEEEVKPLTAEEIEQIRAEAYQDGFEQGKEEGIEAGYQEGVQKGHEEGTQQGYKEGYEAGYGQGKEAVDDEADHWKRLCQQLYSPIDKVDHTVEQQLVNLAVMLAESVVRVESKSNESALLQVLNEAISSLPFNTEFAEIHMHPEDIAFVTEAFDPDTITENKWVLKEEPAYQRGDVIVMTPNSLIDRSVKQRIKQVLDGFTDKTELNKELNQTDFNAQVTSKVESSAQTEQDLSEVEQQQPIADADELEQRSTINTNLESEQQSQSLAIPETDIESEANKDEG